MAESPKPNRSKFFIESDRPHSKTETLWQRLRNRQVVGLKFRRQQVIEGFIADFYCEELKLAVEIDGPIHDDPQQALHDTERTAYLNTQGIRVIRFRNEELHADLPGVLRRIWDVARDQSLPE